MIRYYHNYVCWKTDVCDKHLLLFLRFLEMAWGLKASFFEKLLKVLFFENVYPCHRMITFFQKNAKNASLKALKSRFCYRKTLFAKRYEKAHVLSFSG